MERVRRKDLHSRAQVLRMLPVEIQLKSPLSNSASRTSSIRQISSAISYFTVTWLAPFSPWWLSTPSFWTISQKKSVRTVSYPGILA